MADSKYTLAGRALRTGVQVGVDAWAALDPRVAALKSVADIVAGQVVGAPEQDPLSVRLDSVQTQANAIAAAVGSLTTSIPQDVWEYVPPTHNSLGNMTQDWLRIAWGSALGAYDVWTRSGQFLGDVAGWDAAIVGGSVTCPNDGPLGLWLYTPPGGEEQAFVVWNPRFFIDVEQAMVDGSVAASLLTGPWSGDGLTDE